MSAAAIDTTAFVVGGRGGLRDPARGARRTWLGIAVIAAFVAAPLNGLYRFTGGTMEEGFMLYFPLRMWEGDVPNVDFLHLYGPGALHVLMVWYKAFGFTLEAERTFGLLQHLGIIFALFTLARPWGRKAATAVGVLAVFYVLTPIGLTAMAWNGGLALTLWAAIFAVRAIGLADDPTRAAPRRWAWFLTGLLSGLALTYRPDLVLATAGIVVWLLVAERRRGRPLWFTVGAGTVLGLTSMWVHLAIAGFPAVWRGIVVDPVVNLRAGRELPRPPSWDYLDGALQRIAETVPPWWPLPHLAASRAIFLWFFAMLLITAALLAVAILLRRRRDLRDGRSAALLAVAIVSAGILPQALQRPDSTHLTWVTCIAWPFLVVVGAEVARRWLPRWSLRRGLLAGGAFALLITFTLTSLFTFRYYLLHTRVAVGQVIAPFEVSRDHDGDTYRFYFGAWDAAVAAQQAVDELAAVAQPGERLFVGPVDLRRTWYSDVVFYWMFPELEPATYFIEMDPGLANAPGSGLADDLRTADWVLLTAFWAGWDEPNAAMDFGDPLPNEIVATELCLFNEYGDGLVRLYERC